MMRTRFAIVAMLAGLTACTATHGPQVDLPPRYNVVAGETITVQGNQNVYGIAQAYHVPMREIIVLNNIQPPFVVKSGQTLILPARDGVGTSAGTSPTPQAVTEPAIERAELAPLPPPKEPQKPQDMLVPSPPPVVALNTPTATPQPVATTMAPQPVAVTSPAPTPAAPLPQTPAAVAAAAVTPIHMVWPLQGPVLSAFGPKGQGLSNDGVNIGAPKGTPVVAAASGIVAYAGNEMKGFGNLILIRHEDNWVTAYAHLDRMLVAKDAVVAEGDMIGTVGKTGSVSSPQLHFETRLKDKPVDPNGIIKK